MPLVAFNYYSSKDGDVVLDHYKQTLRIPRHAMNAKWTLESVNAVYYNNDREDFKHLEIDFPELLTSERVLYNTSSLGDTPTPEPGLRFYPKMNALSQYNDAAFFDNPNLFKAFREFPCFQVVSEYPKWSFADTRLETDEISIVLSAKSGNVSSFGYTKLSSCSIILSYE